MTSYNTGRQRNFLIDGDCELYLGDGVSEKNAILRYMGFPKFTDFIQNGLRLTRADIFSREDPFEGEYTEQIYGIAQHVSSGGNGKITTLKENLKNECNKSRRLAFVSCWTLSDSENVALWKLYGGHNNSIAIKTDIALLKGEIEYFLQHSSDKRVILLKWMKKQVVKITYIDHRRHDDFYEMFNLRNAEILHYKNIGYEYEKEVRVIFDSSEQGREAVGEQVGESFTLKIRPEKFIQEILVSPFACDCFFQSVQEEMKKYNMGDRVKWSDLKFVPGES